MCLGSTQLQRGKLLGRFCRLALLRSLASSHLCTQVCQLGGRQLSALFQLSHSFLLLLGSGLGGRHLGSKHGQLPIHQVTQLLESLHASQASHPCFHRGQGCSRLLAGLALGCACSGQLPLQGSQLLGSCSCRLLLGIHAGLQLSDLFNRGKGCQRICMPLLEGRQLCRRRLRRRLRGRKALGGSRLMRCHSCVQLGNLRSEFIVVKDGHRCQASLHGERIGQSQAKHEKISKGLFA